MAIHTPNEGKATIAVEKQTSKIPSILYLTAGLSALVGSMLLMHHGRKHSAMMIGQWGTPFLIMGLYNKLVKTEGHD